MMTSKMHINVDFNKLLSQNNLLKIHKHVHFVSFLIFIYASLTILLYFPCIFKPNFNKITEVKSGTQAKYM